MSPIRGGDLPGFYRDPKTGKYYRENPSDAASNDMVNKIKQSVIADQMAEKSERPKPILSTVTYLRDRELSGVGGYCSVQSYYRMRSANKSLKCEIDLNETQSENPRLSSVEYIKCGPSAIYGMWNRKIKGSHNYNYVVGQIPIDGANYPENMLFHTTNDFVIDMCQDFNRTLVYIANDPVTGSGKLQLVWKSPEFYTTSFDFYASREMTLYSCAHTQFNNLVFHIAVGESNSVTEYDGLSRTFTIEVLGNVHALSYSEDSKKLLFGTSRGMIGVYDIRMEYDQPMPAAVQMKFSDKAVVDAYLLSDEQAILATLDDKLQMFDLRNKRIVTSFVGHHQSVKKRPISVSNNMMCITGADNVIRVWTLSGGEPVHEITSSHPDTQIRGCINGDHKSTYLYYFEGSSEKIFEL